MIKYVVGDATNPVEGNPNALKLICHVNNDIGGWGAGFVLALSAKWTQPETEYRYWAYKREYEKQPFELGNIQIIPVERSKNDKQKVSIAVVNMIAQHGVRFEDGVPPVRYDAIVECLTKIRNKCKGLNYEIHAPRFGAGLAGGDWNKIEGIINATFPEVPVYVYDLR